jgi:hypothetical protein
MSGTILEVGFDGGKWTYGRKRHILVDVLGLLVAVSVTAASVQDRDEAERIFEAFEDDLPRVVGGNSIHAEISGVSLLSAVKTHSPAACADIMKPGVRGLDTRNIRSVFLQVAAA